MTTITKKRKTILAVDDVPANTRLLKAKLLPEGYVVETANSGQELLEKIRSTMPDLILLDVAMPGMDGYEVCRRIRSDASIPYIPLIFITASQIKQKDVIYGLDIGGDDYIRKPFDTLELFSRVRAALRVKGLYDELARAKAELARYVSLSTLKMVEKGTSQEGIQVGQTRSVTVLFSDIRGFTRIAEEMRPEEVFETLNVCLSKQIEVVEAHHGIVDKLTGDQIMAVFEGPDMVRNALQSGMAIVDSLCSLEFRRGDDWIEVGIGVNTGPVYIGSVGSQTMKDYTAVGTTVNIAARLCDLAGKSQILFSEPTRHFIQGKELSYESIGKTSLRGLTSPIEAFQLRQRVG
jgi:adenylate cyclase